MGHLPLMQLVALLFVCVGALLAYGVHAFGWNHGGAASVQNSQSRVDMRWEVLWTGIAAALLLGVFVSIR